MSKVITLDPGGSAPPTRPTTVQLILQAESIMLAILGQPDDPTEDERLALHDAVLAYCVAAEDKVEAIYYVMQAMKDKADALAKEEARIAKRRKRLTREHDGLRGLVTGLLEAHAELTDERFIQGWSVTATLCRSPGSVQVTDLEALAEARPDLVQRREVVEPDKVALKADLNRGMEIPGAALVKYNYPRFS